MLPALVLAIPLFTRLFADCASLQSYAVPVHVDVTLHKLISLRFGLDGDVSFKSPDQLDLQMRRVPDSARKLFSDLGTPQTWMRTYDLQLLDTKSASGRTLYEIEGVPRHASDVDRMRVRIADDGSPIEGEWFLRDGGTVRMTIESATVGSYLLPAREHADITMSGFKIHAEITYGAYNLNAQTTAAVPPGS